MVDINIKDKEGTIVKRIHVRGAQHIGQVVFWIWRDLFLCFLSDGSEADKKMLPSMLDDIEAVYGFTSMEALLRGGSPKKGKQLLV